MGLNDLKCVECKTITTAGLVCITCQRPLCADCKDLSNVCGECEADKFGGDDDDDGYDDRDDDDDDDDEGDDDDAP